mgnify:CR=1 FL=1
MSSPPSRLAPCPHASPALRRGTLTSGVFPMLVAVLAVFTGTPGIAGEPPASGGLSACLNSLKQTSPEISCEYTAFLTDQERADLRRLTRERLQDAVCRVTVLIDRALVRPALSEPNHVFNAPPQPVTCKITTRDSTFDVTGTFAPQVTFKDGVAVTATPGLANVKGVNRYLAWPVVQYVNYAPGIRRDMILIINAYRGRFAR